MQTKQKLTAAWLKRRFRDQGTVVFQNNENGHRLMIRPEELPGLGGRYVTYLDGIKWQQTVSSNTTVKEASRLIEKYNLLYSPPADFYYSALNTYQLASRRSSIGSAIKSFANHKRKPLAEAAGISPNTVSTILCGTRNYSIDNLLQILHQLDLELTITRKPL